LLDHAKDANIPSEPIIIVGVVHPYRTGGGQVGHTKENVWTLHFVFETWRDPNGLLHTTKLIIRCHVTHDEFDWYINRIKPYAILAARVKLTGSKAAELLEILDDPVTADDALAQRAVELQKPKTYEHDVFGILTFDRELDWYRGTTLWAGKDVELYLSTEDSTTHLQAALQVALKLWNDQTRWNEQRDFIIQEKLDLYNNDWRDDDDPELTPEEFRTRVILKAITVYPSGLFEFWHDADYLFGYHTVSIDGSLRDGLTEAKIVG
jgi:hypothetical protein